MAPQHLNRLQLLSDKHLFAGKSSKLSPSLLKSAYANPVNISQSKKSRSDQSQPQSTLKTVTVSGARYPSHARLNADASQLERDALRNEAEISEFDLTLLLRMALSKIPQIPFQYMMDIFRWNFFNGTISMENANVAFWTLAVKEQGIHPPDWEDRKHFFDAGAKFHVADNTPFVRWPRSSQSVFMILWSIWLMWAFSTFVADIFWLASFKHRYLRECAMSPFTEVSTRIEHYLCHCIDAIYTVRNELENCWSKFRWQWVKLSPPTWMIILHLHLQRDSRQALKLGTSVHWTEVLYILTGSRQVSSEALLLYYKPLIDWLEKVAVDYDVPLGWPKSKIWRIFPFYRC